MGDIFMMVTAVAKFSWLTLLLLTLAAGVADSAEICTDRLIVISRSENDLRNGEVIITGVSSFAKDVGSVCPDDFLRTLGNNLVINEVFNIDDYPKKDDYLECQYTVTCEDSEDNDNILFKIIIQDENDEPPVFTNRAPVSLTVNEIWAVGQDVYIFATGEVNDPDVADSPNANKLQLLIVSSTPEINVFAVSGNLGIKLLRALDYEDPSRRRHNLTLQLRDQNNNLGPLHNLVISVQDGDDQPPVFTSSSYKLSITEKELMLRGCYPTQPKISASDGDLAINAPVAYSLESSYFDMDCPSAGDIRLIQPINDSSSTVYNIEIQASQTDVTDRKSKSSLYVEVYRRPVLSQRIYFASVRENSPASSVVLVIHTAYTSELPVQDTDFQINDTTHFQLIKVGKNVAQLEVKGGVTLDYEAATLHVLEVSATSQSMTSEPSIITIHINDTNDNYPEFKQDKYLLEVDEGETDRTKWQLHIEAEDKDSGPDGLIRYFLEAGCKYFDLLPEQPNNQQRSGRTVQAKIDLRGDDPTAQRTTDGLALYACDVIAEDSGSPRLSSRVKVIAHVRDVNDRKPVFTNGLTDSTQIVIGSPSGILVACITATDGDQPGTNNSRIRFSLAQSDELEIHEESGQIRTKKPIEGVSRAINVVVTAFDLGSPQLSEVMTLKVEFVKASLVPFMFERISYDKEVKEDAAADSVIIEVKAKVDNKTLASTQYSILGELVPFIIVPETGEIKVRTILDRETRNIWTFIVAATDTNLPERTAYTTVSVNVTDVNDNHPRFAGLGASSSNEFHAVILEDSPVGTLVACAFATDADEPGSPNAQIEYIIDGTESNAFAIDGATGEIKLNKTLKSGPTVELQVIAFDRGSPRLNATATLSVRIVKAPVVTFEFVKDHYASTVIENSASGVVITTVQAKADGEVTPSTRYFLPDEGIPFEINPTSGEIKLVGDIDRETKSTWTFRVAANDSNLRQRTAFALVSVNVTDVNDNPPRFAGLDGSSSSRFEAVLLEGSPAGTLVACAFATDADEQGSPNAQIEYAIEGTGSSAFAINGTTGEIKLNETLENGPTVELLVVAVDRGSPRLSTTATLSISIVEAPVVTFEFVKDHYESKVIENSASGVVITAVQAKVGGKVTQSTQYFLPDEGIPFVIDSTSGQIKSLGGIDRETKSTWTFRVAANDSNLRQRTAFALVSVNVTDVNDNPPMFAGLGGSSSNRFEAVLIEGSPAGTLVACAFATDADEKGSPNAQIEYTIEGTDSSAFAIDGTTGEIKLNETLKSGPTMELQVIAFDRGTPRLNATATLFVRVVKASVVTFEFVKGHYEATVIENSTSGEIITTIQAKVDGKVTQSTQYFLPDEGIPFAIDATSGDIKLLGNIDREIKSTWTFRVAANDSNLRQRTAFALVSVNVTDVNDNPPRFAGLGGSSSNRFEAVLIEGSPAGTLVACAFATDADEQGSPNAQIEYTIEGTDSGAFAIDGTTGEIKLNETLKSGPTVEFQVIAFDRGSPRLNATATLFARIVAAPVVTFEFVKEHYEATVIENSASGVVITTVQAKVDGKVTQSTQYFLPDEGIPFVIDSTSGEIKSLGGIDRETKSTWTFRVAANESNLRQRTAFALISVNVTDVNDNPPRFAGLSGHSTSRFEAVLIGGSPVGTLVACAFATDADEQGSPNAQIEYAIEGTDSSAFAIDETTGEIKLNETLKSGPTVELQVIAFDRGSPRLNATATLFITIVEAPVVTFEFVKGHYEATVIENSASGQVITTVQAKVDGKVFQSTRYFLPDDEIPFEINATSGEIKLLGDVDREIKSTWTFRVAANDSNLRQRTAFALVSVNVTDVNDNSPRFAGLDGSSSSRFEAVLLEGSPAGTLVACAFATDADEQGSPNAQIEYAIEGTYSSAFAIDRTTGEIKLNETLKSGPEVELQVTAWDRGSPRLNVTATLFVRIVDSPLVTFEFVKDHYESTVIENATSGVVITAVQAMVDGKVSQWTQYSLPDGGIPFEINASSGEIKSLGDFDRETKSTWTFRVAASDSNLRQRTAFALVSVNVTDVNDNPPRFAGLGGSSSSRFEAVLLEGSPAGTLVACAFATDADEEGSPNAHIDYTIEGTDSSVFAIDGTTGEIKLKETLKSNQIADLKVTVSDRGSPRLNTSAPLLIRVVDAPLVTFEFLESHYESTVIENSEPGVVIAVQAQVNGKVSQSTRYSLPDGGIPFEINATSGEIKSLGGIDREIKSTWTFRVAANDSNLRQRTAFALVTIVVADENDNGPAFHDSDSATHAEFRSSTYESAKPGTLVACIYAEDADEPNSNNSLVHYSLSDTEFFNIDPVSGKVFVASSLKKAPVKIEVDVIAVDHGTPQRYSTAALIVIVDKTDVIDISFEEPQYNANLTETGAPGDELVTVAALVNGTASVTTIYSIPVGPLPFTVNRTTGSVSLSDKEEAFSKDAWSFLVTATDAQASQITAFTLVTVQVLSSLPVFAESGYYHAFVSEGTDPPIDVITIKAKSTGGRQIVYKLVSQLSDLPFEIDNETGQLRSSKKLDREEVPSYSFKVLTKYADDKDWSTSHYREANVRVDVTDINDNDPKFGSEKQQFTIDGDAKTGAVLGTVQATDADECVNIIYQLSPEGSKFFAIDNASGVITLRSSESIPAPVYTFTVTAQDYCGTNASGVPLRATDQTIEVDVARPLTYGVPMDCFDWTNQKVLQDRQRNLSIILNMDVVIHNVQPSVPPANVCMQAMIYAIDKNSRTFVPIAKLKAAVDNSKKEIESVVGSGERKSDVQPTEEKDNSIIYVVAALAAVLGVTCIALTAMVCRRRYPKSSPEIAEDDVVTPAGGRRESALPRPISGGTAMNNSGYTGSNGNVSTSKETNIVQNGSAASNREQAAPSRAEPNIMPAEVTRGTTANDATTGGGSSSSEIRPSQKAEVASSPSVPSPQVHPPDAATIPQIIIQAPDTASISGSSEAARRAVDNATIENPSARNADNGTAWSPAASEGARNEQPAPTSAPTSHDSVTIEMDGRSGEQPNSSATTESESVEELSAL